MKSSITFSVGCIVIIASILCTNCKKDDSLTESDVKDVLLKAGKVTPKAADKDEIAGTTSKDSTNGFRYTYEKHDVVDNLESIVYLGLNDDVIWPGNLVKGEKAHDFIYEPISVKRAPLTLSISLESSSTGSSIVEQVYDPKLSTVRQGISNLLKKAITGSTKVPAKVEFSYDEVFSASQMNLFVGADVSYGSGSLSTQFNWDKNSTKHRIMAKYKQIYYSIDVDVPKSPIDFIDPSVTKEQLSAALGTSSCPLYVAGVSYGMMAIMCIETEFTFSQMKMALDAAYSGVVDVKLDFGYTASEVFSKSSVKIIVYGGSTAGLGDIETGLTGFMNVINTSKEFTSSSPGVPLAYKFRHLIDNTLALVTLTSQYTLVMPLKVKQLVKVKVENFTCLLGDDEGTDNRVDMDIFYVLANGFNRANSTAPYVQFNQVDQPVYSYVGGEIQMHHAGQDGAPAIHWVNESLTITFDTENNDFNYAKLNLKAYARDKDNSYSEDAWGEINLTGNDIWGAKKIYLYSSDFTFEVNILVTKENK
jgi:hypothetical protein